ncbi:MAG: Ig-like domain-containing protein, partial [Gemmatimonadota bacterium]
GMIDASGVLSSDSAGVGQVVATVGEVGGSMRVTVRPGALSTIEVAPAEASCVSGETAHFTAIGRDAHGNEVAIEARWSVDGEVGTMDAAGVFTGTVAGKGSIRVAVGPIEGLAAVEVLPGEIVTVAVRPETARIAAGESRSFTAAGLDRHGNEQEITVRWSATAGIGNIDENGRFTATRAGEGQVVAVYEGRTGMAEVSTTAGALAELIIEPTGAEARSGSTVRFTARGRDAAGNPVTGPDVRWSSPGEAGSIDPVTGLWTAVRAGTGRVVASVGDISAEVAVTVLPGEPSRDRSSVAVSPESVPADGETPAEISVVVRDRFNNPIPGAVVSVTSDRPDVVVQVAAETTDESGRVTAQVTSVGPGVALLTVSANGVIVGAEIAVRFQEGERGKGGRS